MKCVKCLLDKPADGFANHMLSARYPKCRICISEITKSRYARDPEFRKKACEKAAKWAKENPEKRRKIERRRDAKIMAQKPIERRCRQLVAQRVYHGRILPASKLLCSNCSNHAKHYHHHNGYSFKTRFDVIPLCVPCHRMAHRKTYGHVNMG
jgi:hypothetical protein